MNWQVVYNRKKFQKKRLPAMVAATMELLIAEIEQYGPVRGNWQITVNCQIIGIIAT